MKPFWTTFYSYKGGVGRSLALANVATLLVERGHRVVLLDFDLEAPGLDSFEEFKDAKEKSGIVEYVAEFQKTEYAPDIKKFVHAVKLPEYLRGQLWIMPAGRKDNAYNNLLTRTHWADLFEGGLGAPFIENWKLSIEKTFRPDYVLIDSRTGLTEIGGVCTTAFPNLVVLLFGLNDQNVEGTKTVVRYIRDAGLDAIPQLHFVATPVPNLPPDKKSLLEKRLKAAEKTLGVEIGLNTIRYWPPASLTERLFVLDKSFRDPVLVEDHKILCGKIAEFNRRGLDFLMYQADEAIKQDNFEIAKKLFEMLALEFPNRAEAVFLRSRLARLEGQSTEVVALAEQSVELDPAYEPPFNYLSTQYQRVKEVGKVESLCEKVLSAGSRLRLSHKIDVLRTLGEVRMSVRKYAQAASHYKEILNLEVPIDDPESFSKAKLVDAFNVAESNRRAGHLMPIEIWKSVLNIFEKIPSLGGSPDLDANRIQAIHVAYAITGNYVVALDCLKKALRAAEQINDLETVFCFRDYQYVSKDDFKVITEEMIVALQRGELWDGTKLPFSQGEAVRD